MVSFILSIIFVIITVIWFILTISYKPERKSDWIFPIYFLIISILIFIRSFSYVPRQSEILAKTVSATSAYAYNLNSTEVSVITEKTYLLICGRGNEVYEVEVDENIYNSSNIGDSYMFANSNATKIEKE